MSDILFSSNNIINISSSIVELNKYATKSGILMKFEKHPISKTGIILRLGSEKYEAIGSSIKDARSKACLEALQNQNFSKKEIKENLENSDNKSSISEIYEIAQKLGQSIDIKYNQCSDRIGINEYECVTTLNNISASAINISKKRAKEECCNILLEKIVSNNKTETHSVVCQEVEDMVVKDLNNENDLKNSELTKDISITPRDYQIELFNKCTTDNSIICLGTGCGKTYIAIMLIRHYAHLTLGSINNGAKRIIFLVPTIALLYQQTDVIRKNVSIPVDKYCGDMGADVWAADKWATEIEKNKILVMTGELFRLLLQHSILKISQICLLIFDECHHAMNSGHYYNKIMTIFYSDAKIKSEMLPRIVGLTATPAINLDSNENVVAQQISDRISVLENIFYSKCLTTAQYLQTLKRFTANFKINIVLYDGIDKNQPLDGDISAKIDKYSCSYIFTPKKKLQFNVVKGNQDMHQFEKIDDDQICGSSYNKLPKNINLEKINNILRKVWIRAKNILSELGIYPLMDYFNSVIINTKIMLSLIDYAEFKTVLEPFIYDVEKITGYLKLKINSVIDLLDLKDIASICNTGLVSSKVSTLLGIILKHYPISAFSEENGTLRSSTIVFVKDRSTSAVLSHFLNTLSVQESVFLNKSPRFSSNYVVGISDCSLHKRLICGLGEMSLNIMNARLEGFSHGAFEILFSTNVLEEGIDVNTCNVVIRFDPFTGIQSYCQSKGRARVLNSYFYVICSRTNIIFTKKQIGVLGKVEKLLETSLLKCCEDSLESIKEKDDTSFLTPEESKLVTKSSIMEIRSAITYLYKYFSKFFNTFSYEISPIYFLQRHEQFYRMILRLPRQTKIFDDIYSDWLPDEKIAKQHCSLRAIKMLHSKKLIDDNFIPISPQNHSNTALSQNIDLATNFEKLKLDVLDSVDKIQNKPNISKPPDLINTIQNSVCPKNYYSKLIPKCLTQNKDSNNYYLSEISFSDFASCKAFDKFKTIINLPSFRLGLISHEKIDTFSFPLASTSHSLQITLSPAFGSLIRLSDAQLNNIFSFNEYLYSKLLKIIPSECSWNISNCHYFLMTVIINDESICFDQMDSCVKLSDDRSFSVIEKEFPESFSLAKRCQNITVIKSYSNDKELYTVTGVDEVKPADYIKDLHKTYIEYYKEKYDIELHDYDNMLSCTICPSTKNMLRRIKQVKMKLKGCLYLPLKAVYPHIFTSALLFKLSIIPSIIKRITDFLVIYNWAQSLLIVSPLCDTRSNDIESFVHSLLDNGSNTLKTAKIERNFNNFYTNLDLYCKKTSADVPIPFYSIFKALTRTSSNECCNYERMECLGDSFFKFITSLLLFTKNDASEGELTFMRDQLVSNDHFFDIGKQLNIPFVMNSKPINFGKNWCPPGYVCNQSISENSLNDAIIYQYIPEKSISDIIESMIGCILLNTNFNQALDFMNKIKVFEKSNINLISSNYCELISELKYVNIINHDINDFDADIKYIESKLNYQFKTKSIIVEALIHPSFLTSPEQKSYERLEFLGDSIIGFLITLYLYLSHEEWHTETLSPYKISHLQHALVNNKILGIISIKNGFSRCLKYKSSSLYESLNNISSIIESLDDSSELKEVPFLGLICKNQELLGCNSKVHNVNVISIPKPASDVLESIIAAVFVDTNFDLVTTAKTFFPIFESYICNYINNFPIHPKIFIETNYPNLIKNNIKLQENLFQTTLKFPENDCVYYGQSTSYKGAYLAACYCLMNKSETK